jgi:NAD(P)-dependent dehydrogenase (short-subunit alcohol dehydrogenase family)
MMRDLVIVTGASRGIGASIAADAEWYARTVVTIASSASSRHGHTQNTANTRPLRLDLADAAEAERRVRAELSCIAPVHSIGLALCAAQLGSFGGLAVADFHDWSRVFAINVLGNLAVLKACLPAVQAGASLRGVFFAGGGAAYGYPEFSAYALSKVAIVRAVENLAMETKSKGWDAAVVALAPGAVETDMLATVMAHGGSVRTKSDISEPTAFVRRFLRGELNAENLNGRFLHVRDDLSGINFAIVSSDLFKLRRVE